MNKELIKKYKKEFDHWVNDGEILMHYGKWVPVTLDAKWEFFISDLEKMGSFGYIINDEYVELRKALAEGKTIQVKCTNGDYYVDTLHPVLFNSPIENYRIKPEESKFKVGDWVYVPAIDAVPCQFSEDLCCLGLELWKPKIGERCWFSDNLYEELILSILTGICYINQQKDTVHKYYTEYSDCNGKNFYKICQPFICVLPIGMKK